MSGELASTILLAAFEDDGPDSALHFLCQNGEVDKPSYDHVVAVEAREEAASVSYNETQESDRESDRDLESLTEKKLLNSAKNSPGINTAGVSNWGGYAVACGLFLLQTCSSHQRYLKKGLSPTENQDQARTWTAGLPSVDKEDEQMKQLLQVTLDPETPTS
ncbi:D-glutamate cyclase, mitochondrial-like [Eucyclogobius newberryi]|uniref:D-glutamate cyclase, mitochondrial-like n=1 Tax=Eucyclogobius newberryi TaxID=166745 RepID=UPI003B5A83D6